MTDQNLDKIYNFIIEINKFKTIERLALIEPAGRRESDAEHTWHLVMSVWLYSSLVEKPIDLLKAIKIALVHDLVEIYAGDVYGLAPAHIRTGKEEREIESAKKLFPLLPEKLADEFMGLWQEYEKGTSIEAKYVWILDKVAPRLQMSITGKDASDGLAIDHIRKEAQNSMIRDFSPVFKKVLEKIYEEN